VGHRAGLNAVDYRKISSQPGIKPWLFNSHTAAVERKIINKDISFIKELSLFLNYFV
jgi:hypothetical protein